MVATIAGSPPRAAQRRLASHPPARTPRAIISPYSRSCSGPTWIAFVPGLGRKASTTTSMDRRCPRRSGVARTPRRTRQAGSPRPRPERSSLPGGPPCKGSWVVRTSQGRVRRTDPLLLLLVTPFLVATAIGLVVLWPSRFHRPPPKDAADLGQLVDARVVSADRHPCANAPPGKSMPCATPRVRLLEGADKGAEITLPEEPVSGPGTVELHPGDTVVLSYHADAEPGFRYALADFERRKPLLALAALFAVA